MKNSRYALVLAGLNCLLLTVPLEGEDFSDLSLFNLDTVVVTGTRNEIRLLQSPVSLTKVESEQILQRPGASVAELLRDIPGVFVTDNTLPGMQRLRIRGEDARRSLILVDGQEISDHSTFGAPLLVDPLLIESIEVVKGPHSTLYGSRAMGGVIHIQTREPSHEPIAASASLNYNSATNGNREGLVLSGTQGEWSYLIAGSNSWNSDREIPGGILPDTSYESHSLMGQLHWSRENHRLIFTLDNYQSSSEANTRDDLVDGFIISKFLLDFPQRDRERIGVFYEAQDLGTTLTHLKVDAFLQENDRAITQEIAGIQLPPTRPPRFYDFRNEDEDTIDTQGLNIQSDWNLLARHKTVLGYNYLLDDLDKTIDRTGTRTIGPVSEPANLLSTTKAAIETQALYFHDQWDIDSKWKLNVGLRYYQVESDLKASNDPALAIDNNKDSRAIGSTSLVYAPSESSVFRAAWSEGYSYPTLLHLHTGSLFGQGNLTRPNPFLDPETSTNVELGYRLKQGPVSLDLTLFESRAKNYLASVRASEVPELGWAPNENTYTNLDNAESRGVELDFEYLPKDSPFAYYLRATHLKRKLQYRTFSTYDNGQPTWVGRIGLRYHKQLSKELIFHLDAQLAGGDESFLRTSRSTRSSDSWQTINLSMGLRLTKDQSWWLGIEAVNLTDELYQPSVDELYQAGRSFNAGVRVEF